MPKSRSRKRGGQLMSGMKEKLKKIAIIATAVAKNAAATAGVAKGLTCTTAKVNKNEEVIQDIIEKISILKEFQGKTGGIMSKSKAPTTVKTPGVDCQEIKDKIQSGSLVNAANEGLAHAGEAKLGDLREYGGSDNSAKVDAMGNKLHQKALGMGIKTTASAGPQKTRFGSFGRFGRGGRSRRRKRRKSRKKRRKSKRKKSRRKRKRSRRKRRR